MNSSPASPLPLGMQRLGRVLMLVGWVLPLAAFAGVALLAPLDSLDRSPLAARGCVSVQALMTNILPQIDFFAHARSIRFPQVATLATSWAILAWPWMVGLTLIVTAITHTGLRLTMASLGGRKLFWLIVGFPAFAALCVLGFFVLPGDPSFAQGLTSSSRPGYAFMGTAALAISTFAIGFWPLMLFTFLRDVLLGKIYHD